MAPLQRLAAVRLHLSAAVAARKRTSNRHHNLFHAARGVFISEIATTAASGQDPVSGAIPGATTLPITAIKAYPTPAGFPGRPMLFVKVECEGGLFLLWGTLCSTNRQLARCLGPFCHTHVPWSRYGWGESGLSGREYAVKGAVEHYTEFLLGRDAMRIGALWQEMCNYTSLRIPRISIETAAFSMENSTKTRPF